MKQSTLFTLLPEFVTTPDGMEIASNGDLIVSCPNFADQSTQGGCLIRIDSDKNIRKWIDVPVSEETGRSHPMGIALGPDGDVYLCDNQGWSGEPEVKEKGRVIRLRIEGDKVVKTTVVASGMEHPNGIRIHGDYMYVTQSLLPRVEDPSGLLVSAVYRFGLNEENINITNTLEDQHILTTFITLNKEDQYGADGIVFDSKGNLYVGNFGDGAIHKITFHEDGTVKENNVWAKDPSQLQTTDGITVDEFDNLYVADFSANAIAKVSADGTVTRIAQSPDTNGHNGELDQPGEPIIWNGKIIVSCFGLVTGAGKVNTGHEMPMTLAELQLD